MMLYIYKLLIFNLMVNQEKLDECFGYTIHSTLLNSFQSFPLQDCPQLQATMKTPLAYLPAKYSE